MAYEKVYLGSFAGLRVSVALKQAGFSSPTAQRLIDRARVFYSPLAAPHAEPSPIKSKTQIINGELFLLRYVPSPKGLKPIFECDEFGVFDKPSGVLSHPNGRACEYSLYDEIYALFGDSACVAHRLDKDTSGLILVAKNKDAARELKGAFEARAVSKRYLALVRGRVDVETLLGENLIFGKANINQAIYDILVDKKLFDKNPYGIDADFAVAAPLELEAQDGVAKIKMGVKAGGKPSITLVRVLDYLPEHDATLVECEPLTGRQHQIRVHMFHMKHHILGDPLYGVSDETAKAILDGKLSSKAKSEATGWDRLCLHASWMKFSFAGREHEFKSDDFVKAFGLDKSSADIV